MKVLIVAKTRRGAGACVGGIAADGRSVRLVAADSGNEHAGLEYEIGEVWEIDPAPDPDIKPPHVENVIVLDARKLRHSDKLDETIRRFMPPAEGGPEGLFEGMVQATPTGSLYISGRTGIPSRSTMFWVPDRPLQLDWEGKRLRYRYPSEDGGRTVTFVGFQEPLPVIPAGALLRVSLAHWWRPQDGAEEELRCFVQLSGWFLKNGSTADKGATVRNTAVSSPDRTNLLPSALETMKQTFGFSTFYPVQGEVIQRVLQRKDTLVIMPTGGGKSLCYQLPALVFEGLTVVISPLVALMQDQVRQLRQAGVSGACLNHTVPLKEYRRVMEEARGGALKILYLAPETLLRPETLVLLEQSRLACFAIDEAHCISEWGHDFRPEYRQLQAVRSRFPKAVCVALTATATGRVRADIRRLLGISPEGEFVASFNRPNLFLAVEPRTDALAQTLAFLEQRRGESGIIYCGTRKQADELAAGLKTNGWPALPYHAGLEDKVRHRNQEQFISDEVPIIVATIAFGMGINKSNVRFVVHAHLPKDIESYYQEIGRAGRDGLPAQCLLLYSFGDAVLHRRFFDEGAASERAGREARLNSLLRFAETRECRRKPLLAYFDEVLPSPCGHCDNCAQEPSPAETVDVTALARNFLSCVEHTRQLFGLEHIVAVLRGSRAARILNRGHDRLPEYGTGKEHSAEQWRKMARQFLRKGLVEQELEYGGLRLTVAGRQVLQGKEQVYVALDRPLTGATSTEKPAQHDSELFEQLRELRRELAYQSHLPPYLIFSDRTLTEMATTFPQTRQELLGITGVGQFKATNYGDAFLEIIRAHCASKGIKPKPQPTPALPDPIEPPVRRRRFEEMGDLFARGGTLEQIAKRFNILPETVIQNLYRFGESGGELDPERLLAMSKLSESDHKRVLEAFEQLGIDRLAPVYEALLQAVPYEELHLMRLYVVAGRGRKVPAG